MRALGLVANPGLPQLNGLRDPRGFEPERRRAFTDTVVSHGALAFVGQALSGKYSLAEPAALTTYFVAYFSNIEELMRYKGQGNTAFLAAANILEEVLIGSLLGLSRQEPMVASELLRRAASFGISKTSVERVAIRLRKERERLKDVGDEEQAELLNAKLYRLQVVFYNRVVPAVRFLLSKENAERVLLGAAVVAMAGDFFTQPCVETVIAEAARPEEEKVAK